MQLHHYYAKQLADLCSPVKASPMLGPRVTLANTALAHELGIDINALHSDNLIKQLFDPQHPMAFNSVAQKYGGHQFGQWNPQLGDGRGLLLGEIKTPLGKLVDLHLKGAGPTPYSRHADGRAVLRSTIREYLASEALNALFIPTSRALCLIATQERVKRDGLELGAMMIRTCKSHIRFGHFEYFHRHGEKNQLDRLFAFCFEHHFSACLNANNPHLAMLTEIIASTAHLVAKWQAYGFNHGVMNTDNMSIHGITFDYGPYAFLDDFIPNYICNRSDHSGRYAFDQQPVIALWNLNALAHAFSKHVEVDALKNALSQFEPVFITSYQGLMHQRFGFFVEQTAQTQVCIDEFMQILKDEFADLHVSFRQLSEQLAHIMQSDGSLFAKGFKQVPRLLLWCKQYQGVMQHQLEIAKQHEEIHLSEISDIQDRMLNINPLTVLRNHHLQSAIAAAENDDFSVCESLLAAVTHPFETRSEWSVFAQPPSKQQKGSALSCSS